MKIYLEYNTILLLFKNTNAVFMCYPILLLSQVKHFVRINI